MIVVELIVVRDNKGNPLRCTKNIAYVVNKTHDLEKEN